MPKAKRRKTLRITVCQGVARLVLDVAKDRGWMVSTVDCSSATMTTISIITGLTPGKVQDAIWNTRMPCGVLGSVYVRVG